MTNQDFFNRPSAKITPRVVITCLAIGLALALVLSVLEASGIDLSGILGTEIGSL